MECFLSPRRTRRYLQCLSFGAIAVWIILGAYMREEEPQASHSAAAVGKQWGGDGGRRLLSLSEPEELEAGKSPLQCAALGMTYLIDNRTVGVNFTEDQCSRIHQLESNFSSCDFVSCVDGCAIEEGLFNYLNFIYCVMPHKLIPLAMILLFFWLIFLFIFLGATAEEYFCPALTVISSVLRLSQNVAGVTLLALGNGAPDIFSAFAAVNQEEDQKASLAIGALFGAGIFVTTIVVGAVTVTKPFMLTQRPFLRDIIFYIFAVFWTFFLLWSNKMDIFNAIGFVALYVFYVIVVILGRVIYQRWKKWRKRGKLGTGDMPRAPSPPEGREMDHSDTTSKPSRSGGLASTYGALLPGVGLPGTYVPATTPNGHAGGAAEGEGDEGKGGDDSNAKEDKESDSGPKLFRIPSMGNSELSTSVGAVNRPVIRVQVEDSVGAPGESSPLFPRINAERRRQKELAQASLPPLLQPQSGSNSPQQPRLGTSVGGDMEGGGRGGYGAIPVSLQADSGSRSPSPTRNRGKMRKTISGALDVTEGVGAVFGIPHVPELWEEVNRSHRSRTSSYRGSRSRTHSTRSTHENTPVPNSDDHAPLLGPTLTVPVVVPGGTNPPSRVEDEDSNSGTSDSEGEEDMAPVIRLGSQQSQNPLLKMLLAFWPFGETFKELGFLGKLYEIVKSPAGFLLTLTVPVIDTNEDDHSWNKWLNVMHCGTAPVFISLITKRGLYNIGGVFPVWTLLLIVGVIVGIIVALTSKSEKPPIYHCIFAWVGFAVAVVWIYSIANEIVNLLQAFGIVIKLSDGILGLTLLAWGNSIGDAVSNVTMAKQGFPRMAIGACFGGPLLNMLLGIGIASVVKSIRRNGLKFTLFFTQVELLAALFLLSSLVCTLIIVSALKFRMRRPYGIFLVAVYVVFLTVAILAEAKVFQISIPGVITEE